MTKTTNNLYYLVCALVALLAALPPELLDVLPRPWKPYIIAAASAAMWIKGHWNLLTMPPGSEAAAALKKAAGQP